MTDEQKDPEFVMEKHDRTINGIIASMLSSPSNRAERPSAVKRQQRITDK